MVEPVVIAQRAVGEYGGAVFVGSSEGDHGERMHMLARAGIDAFCGPVLPAIIQPLLFQMHVVQAVNMAMRGFLRNELLYRDSQRIVFGIVGQQFEAGAHGIDEGLFADRKTHRQSIEIHAAVSIAPVPVTGEALLEINAEFAGAQVGR